MNAATSTPTTITLTEFAAHIGCKQSYASQLKRDGRLVLTDDGKRVLVDASIARIAATRDPSKAGVAERHAQQRGAAAHTGHAPGVQHDDMQDDPDEPDEPDEKDAPATAGNYDYQRAKAKREHFAALAAEATYLEQIKQLLPADEVGAALAEVMVVFRTALESMPHRLAPELAAQSNEAAVKSILTSEAEHILRAMSTALDKIAAGQSAT